MSRAPLERRLREVRPPRADEAERRAWRVVRAAHAGHVPTRGRRGRVRLVLVLAGAVAIAVLALTPAGAEVGEWIDEVVSPAPERDGPGLSSLPATGRLLVVAGDGSWVVSDDGAKRRLGAWRDATWSPGGLYVAAARGTELAALEPDGTVRWARPARGRVATPRWSPDGFRIAYSAGGDLFVVFGDNARGWRLARGVRATAPAWQPGRASGDQVLAYARGGRVRIVAVDSRRELGATPPGPVPRELWWSAGRLVAVSARAVSVHGPRGRLLRRFRLSDGLVVAGSALDASRGRLAVAASRADRRLSELLLYRIDDAARAPRRLFAGPGPIDGLTWSIDGRVLTAGRPLADQWVFVRPRGGPFEVASQIRGQFNGGVAARTGVFPRPAGWCYREPAAQGQRSLPCSTGAAPAG